MRRLASLLPVVTTVIIGIAGLIGLMLFVLSLVAPQTVETLGLGTASLRADLLSRAGNSESFLGIRPLQDGLLLFGSYVLVCGVLWLKGLTGTLLANRSHFK